MKLFCRGVMFIAISTAMLLAGCQTIEGMGKDVQSGGKAISKASSKTQANAKK
jgi:predicted small secreted protein